MAVSVFSKMPKRKQVALGGGLSGNKFKIIIIILRHTSKCSRAVQAH